MSTPADPPAPQELLSHARFVRGLAGQLVRNSADADDVAQDALVAGLAGTGRPRSMRAWLSGAVRRLNLMRNRSEARRRKRELTVLPPSPSSPAQVTAQMEVQRRLVDAVLALQEPYRSTIVHRYFHDLRPEQIADLLGVPLATVRTRLTRAHALLRERLDRLHPSREAWSIPLLGMLDPSMGKASLAAATGATLMAPKTWIAVVLACLASGGVGLWVGVEFVAPAATPASPDRGMSAAGPRTDATSGDAETDRPGPGLAVGPRGGAKPSATPAVPPDVRAVQPPGPASPKIEPGQGAPPKGVASLDELDWARWVPVLVKYAAATGDPNPPESVWSGIGELFAELAPRLQIKRDQVTLEEMLREPGVPSRLAVAAAEHFGAKLTAEQRASLRAEIDKAESEAPGSAPGDLPIDVLAGQVLRIARIYRLLEPAIGAEQASAAVGLLSSLLPDRGVGPIELGPTDAPTFASFVHQAFEGLAGLQSSDARDATSQVREWWERSSRVLHDLARTHGEDLVRASVMSMNEDDASTARARLTATFPGVRSLVWAAMIQEQVTAVHALHAIWSRLAEDRRKSFSVGEPQLILFWPTGS